MARRIRFGLESPMETTLIDANHLKKFGFTLAFAFFGFFGVFFPILFHQSIPVWPWIAGLIILIPTLVKPTILKMIYYPWMKFGSILGWINTRIILGIIFFFLITPLGLFLRMIGKDFLSTRFEKSKQSYRKTSLSQSIKHMEKPF